MTYLGFYVSPVRRGIRNKIVIKDLNIVFTYNGTFGIRFRVTYTTYY